MEMETENDGVAQFFELKKDDFLKDDEKVKNKKWNRDYLLCLLLLLLLLEYWIAVVDKKK